MALLNDKPIVVVEELRPILAELKRQGNNLNQIARSLNAGSPAEKTVSVVAKNCNTTYRALYEAAKKIGGL